ncbi:signal peptide peptidase SppA [Roseateles violae]|uniref:Signal peptide peptidase SppA n=1 Tax=Roseateles violae TaxID=3058042 RepID=A0ABT8DK83_9BURK|nr:signal peptide peptidase SppA [Pelomonas sp. PFR6]MDN3918836.1 signal peptide peptidase SppA [Pelomonas sp. PFR6]
MSIINTVARPLGRFIAKAWWLLDATRRAILNLLLLALIVALLIALLTRGPKPLQDKTTLVLSLDGLLVEQYSGSLREQAMAQLRGGVGGPPRQTRLRDALQALDAAAKDDKIWAVLLDLDDFGGAGLAGLHEVGAALQRFKAAGKPVLAYGDGYSQRAYYLAAQADEVYMHPMGAVMVQGLGRYRNYYKDALDRLGVSANVLRVGTYKNAAEPYFANAPSKASLEAEDYLYGDLWARYTGAVEQARKLPAGALMQGIEQLPQRLAAAGGDSAKLALQSRLIDGIKTRDEMRELLMSRGAKDEKGKSYRRVGLGEYLAHSKPRAKAGADAVAVVVAEGEIVDGEAGPGKVGGDSTARLIRQAREDEQMKAVVLRVNSPGGSAFASEIVRRELELTRKAGKPVVVSMGDVAASGGYWIALSADQVIADAATVTGSIGVFGMLPTADKLLDKLSIRTGGHTTSWLAGGYDPRRPLDPRMAATVQAGIQHVYDEFTAKAAQARGKPVAAIDAVAQGRVWSGAQALERGLVDRLGSLDDALQAAARLAKIEGEPRIEYIERSPSRTERLLAGLGDVLAPSLVEALGVGLGLQPPAALVEAGQELAWLGALSDPARSQGPLPFAALVHCLCKVP